VRWEPGFFFGGFGFRLELFSGFLASDWPGLLRHPFCDALKGADDFAPARFKPSGGRALDKFRSAAN
jgi:hypothetical protein